MAGELSRAGPSASPSRSSAAHMASMHPLFLGDSPTKEAGPSALVNRPIWGQRKGSFVDYSAADTAPVPNRPSGSRTNSASTTAPSSPGRTQTALVDDIDQKPRREATAPLHNRSNIPRTGRVSSYDLQFDDADESQDDQDTLFGRFRPSSPDLFGPDVPRSRVTRPNGFPRQPLISPNQTPMAKRSQRTLSRASFSDDNTSLADPRSSAPTSRPRSAARETPVEDQARQIEYPREWLAELHNLPDSELEEAIAGPSQPKESTPVKSSSRARQSSSQYHTLQLVRALSKALSQTQSQVDRMGLLNIEKDKQHDQGIDRLNQESELRESALTALCLEHGIKEGEIQRSLLRAPVLDAEVFKRKHLAQQQALSNENEIDGGKGAAPALPQSLQQAMLEGLDGVADTSQASFVANLKADTRPQKTPSVRSTTTARSVHNDKTHASAASARLAPSQKSVSVKSSSASIKSDASAESGVRPSSAKLLGSKASTSRSISSSVPNGGSLGDWASGLLPWAAGGASHKSGPTAAASDVKAVSPGRNAIKDPDFDDLFIPHSSSPSKAGAEVANVSMPKTAAVESDDDVSALEQDASSTGSRSSAAAAQGSSARKASKSGLGILGNLAWRRKKASDPPIPQRTAQPADRNMADNTVDVEQSIDQKRGASHDLAKPLAVRSSSNEVPMLLHEAISFDAATSPGTGQTEITQTPLSLLPKPPHFRAIVLATRVLNADPASIFQDSQKAEQLIIRLGADLIGQAREEGKVIEDAPKRKTVSSSTRTRESRPVSMAQLHLSKTVLEEQGKRKAFERPSVPASTSKQALAEKAKSATATTFVRAFGGYARASPVRNQSVQQHEPNVTRLPNTYQFSRDADASISISKSSEQLLAQASPRPPNSAVELDTMLPSDATPPTMMRRRLKSRKSSRKSNTNINGQGILSQNVTDQTSTPTSDRKKRHSRLSLLNEESSGDEFEVYGGKGPVAGFTGHPEGSASLQTRSSAPRESMDLAESETDSEVEEEVQVLTDRYGFIYNATDADIRLLRQARKASAPAPTTLNGSQILAPMRSLNDSRSDDESIPNQDADDSDNDIFDLTANGIRVQRDKETASLKSPLLRPQSGRDVSPYSTDTASITDGYTSNEGTSQNASESSTAVRVKKQKSKKKHGNLLSVSHSKPAAAKMLPVSASSQPISPSTPRSKRSKRREADPTSDVPSLPGSPTKKSTAETGLPSISNTVRLLLTQLKDMHETQQVERKANWDAFLRRRQVQLQKTSHEVNAIDSAGLPEKSGAAKMLGSMEKAPEEAWSSGMVGVNRMGDSKTGKEDWREFLTLCQSGIPVCYRARIWAECSGANDIAEPGRYQELLSEHTGETNACLTQIDLDVHRTMPTNIFFGGDGQGIPKLRRLLVAFSWYNPDTGYCQGMNNLAATLLLTHATEEEAFWVLVCIIEKILPSEYYSSHLLVSQADQRVLKELVEEHMPQLHAHLMDLDVDLPAITFAWFLSLYTDCLPVETLFRVWDVMFVEGMVILFRVAMAILKMHETELLATTSAASLYGLARSMTSRLFSVDRLISLACTELKATIRYANILEKRERHVADLTRELGLDL